MTIPLAAIPTEQVIRVLLIEDNPADVDLIKEALEDVDLSLAIDAPQVALEHVPRLADGLGRLRSAGADDGDGIDVVLLDLSLPDSHGLETFVRLERVAPRVPIIVLSGLADEALAVRAVREGAQDYLVKGQVDGVTLTRSIRYAVERKHGEDERARLARDRAEVEAALRARDEILAAISHDLRTPLTSIMGFTQLLRRRLDRDGGLSPEELGDRLGRIEEQAVQMTRMIDDLLDVARLEAGRALDLRREPANVVALIQEATGAVQRTTEHHRLRVHATEPEIVGELDGARIVRVLQNLLSNAVKYSPDGGDIEVAIRREHDGQDEWTTIEVRDEGMGIPASELPRTFERFFRGSNASDQVRGTGLGLAGARQIVEQHGGQITVSSEEGVGSTFTVRLPLSPPPAEPSPDEDAASV